MKKQIYIIGLIFVNIVACSGGKKQVLESEKIQSEEVSTDIPDKLLVDTLPPKSGISHKEARSIDPANPPIRLKIDDSQENKDFDLADYYSSVRYVTLDFPYKNEFHGYHGDISIHITYENGASSWRGFNSMVLMNGEYIIAGDNYAGYYLYDDKGAFKDAIVKPSNFPPFNESENKIEINWNPDSRYFIGEPQCYKDMFTYSEVKGKKAYANYYSISKQGIYYSTYLRFGPPIPINEKEMVVAHRYNPTATQQIPIIYSFSMQGDTLCRFMNYNPLFEKEIKKAYTNPESTDLFYFDGQLNFRQAYNDTIYSFKNSYTLHPRYILSYIKHKPTIETALLGDKTGKYFISNIKESKDFLYLVYTSNYDCPNNRNNGTVKFNHSIYDKKSKKLYKIAENVFPEEFTVKNSIEGGIQLNLSQLRTFDKKLYTCYTKGQLQTIISSKEFKNYPVAQQEKMESLCKDLPEGSLLVIILE